MTDNFMAELAAAFAPPPDMTVSEWADQYRILSSESSAMPGQWRTDIVEYLREPMDCVGDPRIHRIVIKAASQIAKSEMLLNIIGYLIDYDPSPMMLIQPTLEASEKFSKTRISGLLRDTPSLAAKITDKSRDATSTIREKLFPGGQLVMVGANSPASLASYPMRAALFDEVDRYPLSAGEEGDPVSLAEKRTTTYWNRILVMVSTPTNKGVSRIESAYEEGDQRQRYCPCPHCGHYQTLKWGNVNYTDNKPTTAKYMCEECGVLWTDAERIVAVRKGQWRAEAEFSGVASFHIPGLLSPFTSMSDGVREFLAAKGDPSKMRVWVNTYLGEVWEDKGERIDTHSLAERCEEFDTRVPEDVTILTAGIDVQDDRIELEIVGWGDDFQSWSIDYVKLYGDPSAPGLWQELRATLKQIFNHPIFGPITLRASCIDTGGHYTKNTYDFVRNSDRVYGVKGMPGEGKALVGKPSKNNYGNIPLFPVGVHTAKELVFARLRAKEDEAGYSRFPTGRNREYFDGLTSEQLVTKYTRGQKRMEFVKIRRRNEPLDCRVYATAALELLNVDLRAQRKALEAQARRARETETVPKSKPARSTGFVNKWRDN